MYICTTHAHKCVMYTTNLNVVTPVMGILVCGCSPVDVHIHVAAGERNKI